MRKVDTKPMAVPFILGVVITAIIYLFFCGLLYESADTRNQIRYNEAVFFTAGEIEKDTPPSDILKEAVWVGKIVRSQHKREVDFQELTERVQNPDILSYLKEKKYELIRVAKRSLSLTNMLKPYPAELDTFNALIALAESSNWKEFMASAENKETLRGILQGKIQPPDLSGEYDRGFFLLGYWSLIIIQSAGILLWIIDFLTSESDGQKYRDIYGHWYNLNWKNPFVWIMMLPSCLPFLFISLMANIKRGLAETGDRNSAISSDNGSSEDSRALLEKLQGSIGGTHAKRNS